MKTVVENNIILEKLYPISDEEQYPAMDNSGQERSCFYDFGARSLVEFSGFVNSGNSAFIDEIGRCFS